MENYMVAYTLKHDEIPDTFEDHYIIFKDDEWQENALEEATKSANELLDSDGDKDGWHMWTLHVAEIFMSTDLL
jgi:hypothetical protein